MQASLIIAIGIDRPERNAIDTLWTGLVTVK
jgi:hypothetical protein